MKEFRVVARFTKVYKPRSYKNRVVTNFEDAVKLLEEALEYYGSYNYLESVGIESRNVSDWYSIPYHSKRADGRY